MTAITQTYVTCDPSDGKVIESKAVTFDIERMTVSVDDGVEVVVSTLTEDEAQGVRDTLATKQAQAATEAKKAYAQATVPQLTAASERLYGLSLMLKAQDLPSDEAQAVAAQSLTYVVDVLTAVCAGIADLVNTIDKDVAFRQIRADELP